MSQYPYDPPPEYQPPPLPKQKKHPTGLWIGFGVTLLLLVIVATCNSTSGNSSTATSTDTTNQVTQPAVPPTSQPTEAPTPTPTLVQSPAQIEQTYKDGTTSTTIATLDKDGNNDQGKAVHFTATIASFVKDDSGNTAGANVTDSNYSSFIQVGFPAGTDLSQVNKGDTLEVWGTDMGTFSGTNAFGATIQEVGVSAAYMADQTTGYSTS